MIRKISFILIMGIFLACLKVDLTFAQEKMQSEPLIPPNEAEVQWVWGEVVSVDTHTKQLVVKYLDYETDSEKEITINLDDKTTYENINSIEDIKPQDTVSIDYITSPDGKDIAQNISVEKPENSPTSTEDNTQAEPGAVPGTGIEE